MPIHVRNELQSPSPLWTQQGNYHWTHIEKKFLQQIINQAASSLLSAHKLNQHMYIYKIKIKILYIY